MPLVFDGTLWHDWQMEDEQVWIVARAKPGQIQMALRHLERQEFEYYAPKLKFTAIRRHKVVEKEKFLFLNYVFVEITTRWMALRTTYGISSILMLGGKPSEIHPRVIAELRESEDSDGYFRFDKSEKFRHGQRLRVTGGLLENQFCEFIHLLGANRARVMFGFGVVVLPLEHLVAAGRAPTN
jgi:transcription antitermination factor NusG